MSTKFALFLIVLFCTAFWSPGKAQIDIEALSAIDSTIRVTMNDGSVYVGKLVKDDLGFITLNTDNLGKINITKIQIKRLEILETKRFKGGKYWFENPNYTRYLFGPTAIPLKQGEGYYQNIYIILQSFNYGITNNFSLGGGFDIILPFTGEMPFLFLTPRVGFKVAEKWHAGGGLLYAGMPDEFNMGIAYGVVTYGTIEHNLTGGLGWGFFDYEFASQPIITISGMTRAGKRIGLVSENWIVPIDNYYLVVSYGLRFMGEKITIDFAFLNSRDIIEEIVIGIPYIDFVFKF